MAIDINLLGKRYIELTPTSSVLNNSLIAIYKIGEPELNSITFSAFQGNIQLKNLFDFQSETLADGNLIKWNTAQDKFVPGILLESDIPNLPASKITSGVFDPARIPNLSISSITGLQDALNEKEDAFLKGDLLSSTLIVSNNLGRLYGPDNLVVEIDIASIIEEVASSLNYYQTDIFVYDDTNIFDLTYIPTRLEVFIFGVGDELGLLLDPLFYEVDGTEITINTTLVEGDKVFVKYFYDDPLYPNIAVNLQDVTNRGNTTTLRIVHAPALSPNESATLGQTLDLFVRRDIDDTKVGTLTLVDDLIAQSNIIQNRSIEPNHSVRRDELGLHEVQISSAVGVVNDLNITQGTKLLVLTDADELTGLDLEENFLIRIEARGTDVLIRNESVLSLEQNRFYIGEDLLILDQEVFQFIKTDGKLKFVKSTSTPPLTPNLQEVTEVGNTTDRKLEHAPAEFENESVTLGQLNDAIASVNVGLPDGLISGGIVSWTGVDYDYIVSKATLRELGLVYVIPADPLVAFSPFTISPGDAVFPRKDTIVVSSAGFQVLEGTPSVDPIEPQPTGLQIRLTVIDVPALSTAPPSTSLIDVYKENLEYSVAHVGVGSSNPDDLTNPFEGAKAVNVSSVENNSATVFTAPADVDFASIDSATLRLRLKESFAAGHNVGIQFLDISNNPVSDTLVLSINKTLVNSYQFLAFAMTQFTPTATSFRKISFRFIRTGNQTSRQGYFIDNFILQGGVSQPPVTAFNVTLTNEVSGSGNSDAPISVVLTEKAISNRDEALGVGELDEFLIRTESGELRKVKKENLGIGLVETIEEKFTWTTGPTTFTLNEIPDSIPLVFLNTLLLDRTFWLLTDDELTITEAIPVDSKIVVYYYQNVSGTGLREAPINGLTYGRRDGGWIEVGEGGYPEAEIRESNTVLFDKDYIIGNAGARTGNILFNFVNAKLGAVTFFKHNNSGAYTWPSEVEPLNWVLTDLDNVTGDVIFTFTLVDKTASSEVVLMGLLLTPAQMAEL